MTNKHLIFILLLIDPSMSFANALCPDAKTTREIADCIIVQTQQAEQDMDKYLSAAVQRYKKQTEVVDSINASQED